MSESGALNGRLVLRGKSADAALRELLALQTANLPVLQAVRLQSGADA